MSIVRDLDHLKTELSRLEDDLNNLSWRVNEIIKYIDLTIEEIEENDE